MRSAIIASLVACLLGGCSAVSLRQGEAAASPGAAGVPLALGGVAFRSMQWQVRVPALPAGLAQATLQRQLQAAVDRVDASLSSWRDDSDVARVNRAGIQDWVTVSPLLYQALQTAQGISRLTGGAYDVSIGPLVELWGFGTAPSPQALPTPAQIMAARARVDWQRIGLDPAAPQVRRLGPLRLDLSSVGEGTAVDAMVAVLAQAGVRDYLVRVAGTSRQAGARPGGGAWSLAVERPDGSGQPGRVLAVADSVVSTSGDYRNQRSIAGRRFSHTLDPRTGWPVTHAGASVTVVLPATQGAVRADAIATALNVLGPDAGLALAEQQGWAVLFLERQGEGFRERWSSAFSPYRGN